MGTTASTSPARQRILIVEDEPLIAFALETMLLEVGFDVAGPVGQVAAALEAIGSEAIDGAVLDVTLGSQRIDAVADALAALSCPFFFTTGHGIAELPVNHSGRAVLQKPFRMEQLVKVVRAIFGSPIKGRPALEPEARSLAG